MAPLWQAILAAFTFHLNWLEARYGFLPANWDVLWSLSVEEMFYLFFPLVCLLCFRLRRGMMLFTAILIAFVIVGPFEKTIWTTNAVWQETSYLGGMDAIALGCLAALFTEQLRVRKKGLWLRDHYIFPLLLQLVGGVLILVTAPGPDWYWKVFPYKVEVYDSLLALGACAVMCGSVLGQPLERSAFLSRFTAPLRWYGRRSYELYLTHEFIVIWAVFLFLHWHPAATLGQTAPHQPALPEMALWIVAVILMTVPLAWVTARFFSEPDERCAAGRQAAAAVAEPLIARLRTPGTPPRTPPHDPADKSLQRLRAPMHREHLMYLPNASSKRNGRPCLRMTAHYYRP